METKLGGLFVFLVVSGSWSSVETIEEGAGNGLDIKIGNFHVLKQHPAIKKCMATILHEKKYFALRVNELTGECQGLPHSWLLNSTIESGYAYAKRISVKEQFHPPADLRSDVNFDIPGVFSAGTKLDVFLSIAKPHYPMYLILSLMYNFWISSGSYFRFEISTRPGDERIEFAELIHDPYAHEYNKYAEEFNNEWPTPLTSKKVFKISFLAKNDSITTLIEEEEINTLKFTGRIAMRDLFIANAESEKGGYPVFLHGVQFTGK